MSDMSKLMMRMMEEREWYEIVDADGGPWFPSGFAALRAARREQEELARTYPERAPFRILRVTETREEVT